MSQLTGQVALVTGAEVGIGRATALALARAGASVAVHFYADEAGLEKLKTVLQLSVAGKGENVIVTIPKDRGILMDTVEPAPGAVCTDPVQTYLDLSAAGERGREAAEYLRREQLKWPS